MPLDNLIALVLLALASTWTPGPNNALVAASGANFGLRRSLPHVAGISLGFAFMIFVVGLFLGQLFQQSALLRETLRWGGAALLLWIAFKLATSGGIGRSGSRPRPFTFVEAAAFQWINPKAWAMSIAVTAQFSNPDHPLVLALLVAGVFVLAGFSSSFAWASAGQAMTRWINTSTRLSWFNRTMALLIAACVGLLFLD